MTIEDKNQTAGNLFARIAIQTPLRQLFEYSIPQSLLHAERKSIVEPEKALLGRRVTIPFGNRKRVVGVVVEVQNSPSYPPEKVKPVLSFIDDYPVLPEFTIKLIRWATRYYHHPAGDALLQALPPGLKHGIKISPQSPPTYYAASPTLRDQAALRSNATRLKQLLATVIGAATPIAEDELRALGFTKAQMAQLVNRQLIIEAAPPPPSAQEESPAREVHLRPEQQNAFSAIVTAWGTFQTFVLQGVTGSGKTEIYIKLAEQALVANQQILVLIPEINLTPQTFHRFTQHFPPQLCALHHSGLSESEKTHNWHGVLTNDTKILIGTRSAIFYPFQKLASIVVDEEHDNSYKQQDSFRYSARDLAVTLGSYHQCPVVLGSATPSLESLVNVLHGKYIALQLQERHAGARQPKIDVIDLRIEKAQSGISNKLTQATQQHLAAGNQVLYFINRKGFAPALTCHDCGWIAGCQHCDTRLTYYKQANQLRCQHCNTTYQAVQFCPECHSLNVHASGEGTERIEETLHQLYPDTPIYRIDRDTTSKKQSMDTFYHEIKKGLPCILVGTQMLAKGHDFPKLTLVGILAADDGLFSADYRAGEKATQLLIQVAGRAGRGAQRGQVLLQTRQPEHPLIQLIKTLDYPKASQLLLAERAACDLPPYQASACIKVDSNDLVRTLDTLNLIQHQLSREADQLNVLTSIVVPVTQKKAGRFRQLLLIHSPNRKHLQIYLTHLENFITKYPFGRGIRILIDVDPTELN